MDTTQPTGAALIDESVSQTAIAHATYSETRNKDLLVECEDSTENGPVVEYWGTTETGATWRVHLTRE
jgi:hypothetical protein